MLKISDEISKLINEREYAKRNKDFKKSDEIRDRILKDHGLKLVDEKDGSTRWMKV